MWQNFVIGIVFIIILASVTHRGYIEGPAILIPIAVSIAAALIITGICDALFPSLYIPFISGLGNVFGMKITAGQINSAKLQSYCSTGIQIAKSAFASFIAIATAIPSGAVLYKNLYLVRRADSVLRKGLRILGALTAFIICILILWAVEAFICASAGESSFFTAAANALTQDKIIAAICRQNPLQDAITSFIHNG